MSYYRDSEDDLLIQALVGVRTRYRPKPDAQKRADAFGELAGRELRSKGQPCAHALPRTKAWAMTLPTKARPVHLIHRFGRIANLLAASWDDVDVTYAYLDELLVDRRGNRDGFPPEVHAEIVALRQCYEAMPHRRAGAWVAFSRKR